jgi:hypothetical protein
MTIPNSQRISTLVKSAASHINETWRGKDDACDRIAQAATNISYEVYFAQSVILSTQ